MKLLVIGATGGTGRQLIEQALERGYTVTAFARKPSRIRIADERLHVVQGDVLDAASVEQAVQGQDAVVSALGHKRWIIPTSILSRGTRNIIRAMEHHGVKRLVCQTSLGIGDSRGKLGLYYTLFVIPVIVYFYFRDKERQERLIRESKLDWTIVRPGQLTNGKKRGQYRHGHGVGSWLRTVSVSRADVAAFMLDQLKSDAYLRQSPGIAYQRIS